MATEEQLRRIAELEEAERANDDLERLGKPSTRGRQDPLPCPVFFRREGGLTYIRPRARLRHWRAA